MKKQNLYRVTYPISSDTTRVFLIVAKSMKRAKKIATKQSVSEYFTPKENEVKAELIKAFSKGILTAEIISNPTLKQA